MVRTIPSLCELQLDTFSFFGNLDVNSDIREVDAEIWKLWDRYLEIRNKRGDICKDNFNRVSWTEEESDALHRKWLLVCFYRCEMQVEVADWAQRVLDSERVVTSSADRLSLGLHVEKRGYWAERTTRWSEDVWA